MGEGRNIRGVLFFCKINLSWYALRDRNYLEGREGGRRLVSAVDRRETRQDKTRDDACPSLTINVKVPHRVSTHIKGKGTLTSSSFVTLSLIGTLSSSLVWPCHAMPAPSVYPYDWGVLEILVAKTAVCIKLPCRPCRRGRTC